MFLFMDLCLILGEIIINSKNINLNGLPPQNFILTNFIYYVNIILMFSLLKYSEHS